MSYLVLARKYRPGSFAAVSGQEHVTRTLANAIKRNKVAHAYLFAGPRGVGKTSISRIFSKALNCEKGPTVEPCLECRNCLEIAAGTSLAVREIDGASHNSVDNVRELIDSFRALPPPGSLYKIYIIDEVHMLSTSAFNALLKSLEEPPPNTVFILATTEAHKIPDTVISRCQRHDFRALSFAEIENRLREIAKSEKISIEAEPLRMIARLSEGSMRDAQTLLDRVQSFCDGKITPEATSIALGSVEQRVLIEISRAIFAHAADKALTQLGSCFASGVDPALFLKEFAAHWRDVLMARFGSAEALQVLALSVEDKKELEQISAGVSNTDLQDLAYLAREGADQALRSAYPKYALESLLVRMATREPVQDIGVIVQHLKGVLGSAPRMTGGGTVAQPVRQDSAPRTTAPVDASRPAAAATSAAKGGDWADFVGFVSSKVSKILAEQLKRLSIESFGSGKVLASGPDFYVQSLSTKEAKEKLAKALEGFSGTSNWVFQLKAVEAGAAVAGPGSLLEEEMKERRAQEKERAQTISNHPKIKSLQKVFPGSTIEGIKVREDR